MLAVWWRPIADLSLFDAVALTSGSASEDDSIVAVLDTNVVRDLRDGRDEGASRALLADWVDDHADLVITAEVARELLALGRRANPDPASGHEHEFRQLEAADALVNELFATLRGASSLSANQDADLRVVAETAVGGATHLITRDEGLLRSTDAIESLVGVTVLNPADFLLSILADSSDAFEPQFIKTSGFAIQRRGSVPANSALADFTHQMWNERAAELRDRIFAAVGESDGCIEDVTAAGRPWALAAHFTEGISLRVSALRSLRDRRAYSVLRQLIHRLRQRAVSLGVARVDIVDAVDQSVGRALHDEGFVNVDGLWRAEVFQRVIGCDDALPHDLGLSHVEAERLPSALISRIELERWPLKLFTGAVPCLVVPVRPSYGRTLLGYREAQMTLIETSSEAAIARENAYYMARRSGLTTPARILWWVTGGGPEGGLRAMSWLDSVDTGTPERLHRRYSRRGVFDLHQVRQSATSGRGDSPTATVLLFSRTDVFDHPVNAQRARELGPDDIWQQGFANTARSVSERTAEALYREGMGLLQPDTHE